MREFYFISKFNILNITFVKLFPVKIVTNMYVNCACKTGYVLQTFLFHKKILITSWSGISNIHIVTGSGTSMCNIFVYPMKYTPSLRQ